MYLGEVNNREKSTSNDDDYYCRGDVGKVLNQPHAECFPFICLALPVNVALWYVVCDGSFSRTKKLPMEVLWISRNCKRECHWSWSFKDTLGKAQSLSACKPGIPIVWILATPYHIHTSTHANTTVCSTSPLKNFSYCGWFSPVYVGYYTSTISILYICIPHMPSTCASGHCL